MNIKRAVKKVAELGAITDEMNVAIEAAAVWYQSKPGWATVSDWDFWFKELKRRQEKAIRLRNQAKKLWQYVYKNLPHHVWVQYNPSKGILYTNTRIYMTGWAKGNMPEWGKVAFNKYAYLFLDKHGTEFSY